MTMDVVLESNENIFRGSDNPAMRVVAGEGPKQKPTYNSENIFVGWNIGDKNEFEQLVKQCQRQLQLDGIKPRAARNEGVQQAIRQFRKLVGDRRNEVFLERSEPDLAFWAGERGSGKSYCLREETNRSAEAGLTNIIVDPEHEYVSNNFYNGIQSSLENLRSREEPKNIDTKVLMPHFVYKAREDNSMPQTGYEHMDVFKFGFNDLDPNDLNFVFTRKFKDHHDFYEFTSRLEGRLSRGEPIRSWQDVIDLAHKLQEEEEFDYRRRADQIERFVKSQYQKWGFLGPDRKIDLKQILNDYNTIVLSLHDGEWLPDDLYMKELYVAFLIKRVRTLVERGEVPDQTRWTLDEAHKYAPAHTEPEHPPSKAEVRRLIKRDRKRGQSLNMASQEPTDVAGKNFLNQTKHLFIPQNMKPTPRKHLLKTANVWRSGDASRNKWDLIFEALDKYQWLYVNSETGYWCGLEVASPLAYHLEA
jgi:hypothetical protein